MSTAEKTLEGLTLLKGKHTNAAQGMCISTSARFWAKVDRSDIDGCWVWTGGTSAGGYGRFSLSHRLLVGAHRFSYEEASGPIATGLQIDHLCRNPRCVRPDHLEAVTPRANLLRGRTVAAASAAKKECDSGHRFNEENTYHDPRGFRGCRACRRLAKRRYVAARRSA